MEKNKIEELQAFLMEEPEDSFIKYALALEYVKIENFELAHAYFAEILEKDENYLPAYYHSGILLEKMNRPAEAELIYLKGIGIARKQGKKHTQAELEQAYALLKDLEDE